MSSPDKCPHCGSPAKPNEDGEMDGEFECGRIAESYNEPEFRSLLCRNRELAATRKELEQFKAECGIAHDQRMDAENERRNETRRAELAESRVRELESLRVSGFKKITGHVWITVERQTDTVNLSATTLGEAMPRKEEK